VPTNHMPAGDTRRFLTQFRLI